MKDLLSSEAIGLPIGSLDAYIHKVNHIPMLTLEEEQELARRWCQDNDLSAARRLIMSHLRYVVKVARSYNGYGLALSDIIQEGNIGLMKAVKRFDPTKGVRLVTFAVHWIKAEIHEFILRNWRMVKVATTKAQRKLFFNIRNCRKTLNWLTSTEIKNIAEKLDVREKDVRDMEERMNGYDESFSAPDLDDDATGSSGRAFSPADYLTAPEASDPAVYYERSQESSDKTSSLESAMGQLDARSSDILQRRWLSANKVTLHELAAEYEVSAERIRQLEKNAMRKVKKIMEGELVSA